MATKYLEEFATEADFLAASPDAPNKLGVASISGEYVVVNKSGSAIELVDETRAQTLTNKTFTAPVVNTPTRTDLTEVVTTTNVIAAAESGSVFFLGSATGFVSTLPAVAAGLRFTFIVSTAPTSGSHTVVGASGTPIKGHVLTNDVNSATDADFGTAGELTITFVVNKAVAGDRAELYCDGTNWFVTASCSVFDAITIS